MPDPNRVQPDDVPAEAGTPGAPPASGAAAAVGPLRTAIGLVLSPLDDALDDSEHPLLPAQRERIALARRSATALLSLVEGLIDGSGPRSAPDASYAPVDLSAATRE